MEIIKFEIPQREFKRLEREFAYEGKSSDIGHYALEIVRLYFESKGMKVELDRSREGADIVVGAGHHKVKYEVKGTQDSSIAFSKIKVSSTKSHKALEQGLVMIRVTNIRKREVTLYFLKCGTHFELVQEPRWSVKKIRQKK